MHHPGGGDASEQNLGMPKRVLELTGREGKAKTEIGNVKGSYRPTSY